MPFLITFWKPIAVILIIGGLWIWGSVQTMRLRAEQAEFKGFVTQVEAIGKNQIENNKRKHAANLLLKKGLDDENETIKRSLRTELTRLRNANPGRSDLPAVPSTSRRPDLLCLDRAEYQRTDGEALSRLFAGARSLADEGTTSTVDLDTGKKWVQEQVKHKE